MAAASCMGHCAVRAPAGGHAGHAAGVRGTERRESTRRDAAWLFLLRGRLAAALARRARGAAAAHGPRAAAAERARGPGASARAETAGAAAEAAARRGTAAATGARRPERAAGAAGARAAAET